MNVSDMYTYVSRLVDDVPIVDDVIGWLNAGQNIMASECQALFPQLQSSVADPTMAGTFVFPVKWHHIPCIYAAAMYKAQDTSFQEEQMFMQQFNDLKKTFVQYYDAPEQYVDSAISQQFMASAGQTTFVITKNTYNPQFGDLKVYVNGIADNNFTIPTNLYPGPTTIITTTTTSSNDPNSFTLGIACNANDLVSCVWEEHFDLVNPPYNFWTW